MAEKEIKLHPLAGWHFEMLPGGNLYVRLDYVDAEQFPRSAEELQKSVRFLRVSMTVAQADQLAIAVHLAADKARPGGTRETN